MQIASDVKRAKKLAKKVLAGRRALFGVRELIAERGPLPENRYRVGVYFADSDVNIYQMRQWYAPLQELSKTHPVLLIARHPAGAKLLMEESGLDVAFTQKVTDIEKLLEEQPLEVVLYVNQNTRNFQMMRYGRRWHVFINHGESDKMYMVSNQYKAYDFAFIAGDAARERLSRVLWDYDLDSRTFSIGRPQNDHLAGEPPFQPDDRTVVLYAPTWEGDRPSMAYGSIESAGRQIVSSLLAGGYRVIYRPHPLSGTQSPTYGHADREIRQTLNRATAALPAGRPRHVIDTAARIDTQIAESDVAIVDNSAMAFDWLVTGKPLIVTVPVHESAAGAHNNFLSACYRLRAEDAGAAAQQVGEALAHDTLRGQRDYWVDRHFGDVSPGACTRRFIEATREVAEFGAEQLRLTQQRAAELAARELGPSLD